MLQGCQNIGEVLLRKLCPRYPDSPVNGDPTSVPRYPDSSLTGLLVIRTKFDGCRFYNFLSHFTYLNRYIDIYPPSFGSLFNVTKQIMDERREKNIVKVTTLDLFFHQKLDRIFLS